MLNKKNSIPSQGTLYLDYLETLGSVNASHSDVTDAFDGINALYSESSVMEDIILEKYLYLYSAAKQITPDAQKSTFVTESFLSQNFSDKEFPLDRKLNIDIQNGDLTLPIITTTDIDIDSIIIESDSNGGIGDSENNGDNSDISVIASNTPDSIFIYDKVVNSLSMSTLYLSLMLRLDKLTSVNGIYIQLYSDTGSAYPTIDFIQGSEDGIEWYDIASEFKISELSNINKADYYIRFQARETRYIRVRFSQNDYSPVTTGFGTRYRYMIGIRNISVKQTVYATSGTYVSTPFSNKTSVSFLNLTTEDTGGAKYYVSANNGSIWQKISPNEKLYLYNSTLGLRDGIDINNIRLKIEMDKGSTSINKEKVDEFAIINDSGGYFLQNIPIDTTVNIGNHISYGDLQPYTLQLSDITTIPSGILEDDENIDHTAILYYVPYTEDMQDKMVLKLSGAKVKNDTALYTFAPHQDKRHSIIVFKNPQLTSTSGVLTLSYKMLELSPGQQEINLPSESFLTSSDAFLVQEVGAKTLTSFQYTVENGVLRINDVAFNKDSRYTVSYYPSVDITSLVDSTDTNQVTLQGMKNAPNARLKFSYYVSSETGSEELKYFTPISNQYILEFR